jgi:hypothetical protein
MDQKSRLAFRFFYISESNYPYCLALSFLYLSSMLRLWYINALSVK